MGNKNTNASRMNMVQKIYYFFSGHRFDRAHLMLLTVCYALYFFYCPRFLSNALIMQTADVAGTMAPWPCFTFLEEMKL